jgi:hypothetical protein
MIPQALSTILQPAVAIAIGIGALATVPLIGASGSSEEESDTVADLPSDQNPPQFQFQWDANFITDPARSLVKTSLVWFFDILDQTQGFFAEATESIQDLVSEAKLEQQNIAKARGESGNVGNKDGTPPSEIEIEE